jgi:hypothetical protein
VRTEVEEHTFADNPSSAAIVERDLQQFSERRTGLRP